jgi:hypothetical protein
MKLELFAITFLLLLTISKQDEGSIVDSKDEIVLD